MPLDIDLREYISGTGAIHFQQSHLCRLVLGSHKPADLLPPDEEHHHYCRAIFDAAGCTHELLVHTHRDGDMKGPQTQGMQ